MDDSSRSALCISFPDVEFALYEDVKARVKAYEVAKFSTGKGKRKRGAKRDASGGLPIANGGSGSDTDDDAPVVELLGAFR